MILRFNAVKLDTGKILCSFRTVPKDDYNSYYILIFSNSFLNNKIHKRIPLSLSHTQIGGILDTISSHWL